MCERMDCVQGNAPIIDPISKIMSTLTQITANAAGYSRRTDPTVIRLDHYTDCRQYNGPFSR